jgi:hypothetical protein
MANWQACNNKVMMKKLMKLRMCHATREGYEGCAAGAVRSAAEHGTP